MSHPTRENSRFEESLLPHSMYNSIETWLPREFLPAGPTLDRINTYLYKFRSEFIHYIENATQDQIPAMIKACKERTSLLCDFCQSVIELTLNNYSLYVMNKEYQELPNNYKVRFARKVLAYKDEQDFVDLDINITNNPRMYKYLYYAAEVAMRELENSQIQFLMIHLQSLAYIYESVKLTDQEIYDAEQEFIQAATSEDCWNPQGELAVIMKKVGKDLRSSNPPEYIRDFKQARRSHDGYIYNHPWTIDDAWYSVASSGSSLEIDGKRVPNIGLLMSAFEPDQADPVDQMIQYKSYYTEPYPGLEFRPSSTTFVPKTSSRGLRCIHPNSNPRQDRGSYFENMEKHILSNVLKCDTTYDNDEGLRFIKEKELQSDIYLICTDIHAATDAISHTFLKQFWDMMYMPGISDFLLRIHSGEGNMLHHVWNEHGKLQKQRDDYCQISGIKCGTRSNFAVGLTEPHNFIVRCTMKAMEMEDIDPSTLYRVHGDDIVFALPDDIAEEFVSKYCQLANEAGFRVHDLQSKGMKSHSSDLLFRAEFNKQTLSHGRIVSRIPHRLFFRNMSRQNQIEVLLWLSQYTYLQNPSNILDKMFMQDPIRYDRFCAVWNFLIDKKLFGIPKSMWITHAKELDMQQQFEVALTIFNSSLQKGVFDTVFNNRQRLSDEEVRKKVQRFTEFYDSDIIEKALGWLESHGITMSKLHWTLEKNQRLADELRQLYHDEVLYFNTLMNFFTEEDKLLIRKCLPYVRLSGLDYDESVIDSLLQTSQILKRVQPHSIGKRVHLSTSIIMDALNCYVQNLDLNPVGIPENP